MYWNYHMGGGMLGLAIVEQVLLTGALIAFAVFVVRAVPRPRRVEATTAEEILARRYARGEIDDHEYARRLAQLHQQN